MSEQKEQKRFRSVLTEYCASLRIITGIFATIEEKRIEVSIRARGNRKSKRLKNLVKRVRRMERKLKRTFPKRKVRVDIWATDKKSLREKDSKPFRGKDIILIGNAKKL